MAATALLVGACGPAKSNAAGTRPSSAGQSTKPAGNGIEAKSADEILSAATAALVGAKSVHLKGTTEDAGDTLDVDLFVGVEQARGSLSAPVDSGKIVPASIIRTEKAVYLKSPGLWQSVAGGAAATKIGDRWVLIPAQSASDFKDIDQVTNIKALGKGLLKPKGPMTKGSTAVIDGVPAIGLVDSDGSTLYVATTGTAYPLKLVPKKPKKPGEALSFLDYNAPLTVTPPANPFNLNQLGH